MTMFALLNLVANDLIDERDSETFDSVQSNSVHVDSNKVIPEPANNV